MKQFAHRFRQLEGMKYFVLLPFGLTLAFTAVAAYYYTQWGISAGALFKFFLLLAGASMTITVVAAIIMMQTGRHKRRTKRPVRLPLTRSQCLYACVTAFFTLAIVFFALAVRWDTKPDVGAGEHFWNYIFATELALIATAVTAIVKARLEPPSE